MNNILSILVFLPLAAALLILILPEGFRERLKHIALGTSLLQFVISLYIYLNFHSSASGAGINNESQFQLLEKFQWIRLDLGSIGKLEIDYMLGIDGLSMPFLILSALVMFVATLASWEIKTNVKGFFALLLLLNTAVMGVFCALDFSEKRITTNKRRKYFVLNIIGACKNVNRKVQLFIISCKFTNNNVT